MARRNLKHFDQMAQMKHVFDHKVHHTQKPIDWQAVFANQNPIVVELGCGHGSYTLALAQQNAHKNYIGIDLKGARMWHGATAAHDKKLANVAFLRTHILEISRFFEPNAVDEIWLTFPDPQPATANEKKRLTSNQFINLYKKIVKKNALIHLKTDDKDLFHFSEQSFEDNKLSVIEKSKDIYTEKLDQRLTELQIKTTFEHKWLAQNKPIHYIKACI